jgi:hypothetical protein
MGDTTTTNNNNDNSTTLLLNLFAKDKVGKGPVFQGYSRQTTPLSRCLELISLGDKGLTEAFRNEAVCEFLTLVASGQEKQVEELLKAHPKLLLEAGLAKDYSGRKILGTAYQIALGAEDMDMCKMMEQYFALLKDADGHSIGEAEKKKQFETQFPDGKIESEPSDYDFSDLITAISNDNVANNLPNDATEKAIKKFQKDFTPNSEETITTGKHFNMQHQIKAYEIYLEKYYAWNDEQRSLFWRQVIGHLQRQVPACYAQAYCTGLYSLVETNMPLERKFGLIGGGDFFPLDRNPDYKLGRDYAIYSGWVGPGPMVQGCAHAAGCRRRVWLCRAKTSELGKLKTRLHSAGQKVEKIQDNQPQIVSDRTNN